MGKRFIIYGFIGICAEIFWTGMCSFFHGDVKLTGSTYVWMFPIYGLTVFSEQLQHKIESWPLVVRGGVYTIMIFIVEYTSGLILKEVIGVCPWKYIGIGSVNGLINFKFAPLWFLFSIALERVHRTLDKVSVLIRT